MGKRLMAGRPSLFSEEIADHICEALMEGRSMRQVCDDEGMPHRATVLRWMAENEAFATKCARAREMQADLMDDLVLETARACTSETAQADRVRIAAFQWRAAKLQPKKYGDRLDLNANVSMSFTDACAEADAIRRSRSG